MTTLLPQDSFNDSILSELGLELNAKSGGVLKSLAIGSEVKNKNGYYHIESLLGSEIHFYSARHFMDTIKETEEQLNILLFN